MIFFLDKSLVFWSGVLAGLLFIFSFLSCRCLIGKKFSVCSISLFNKNHNFIMWLTLIMAIIHMSLAILASFGIYI